MVKAVLSLLVFCVLVNTLSAVAPCAPCDGVQCVPPPPGCELGRRPCSCCLECRVKEGRSCGPFTPECESHLVCSTYDGKIHVGRPPVDSMVSGRCTSPSNVPLPSLSAGRIGKK